MKKDLTKLAMVGLLAGFCLSANAPEGGKEIAMSKCSKDNSSKSGCNSKSGCSDNSKDDKSSCNSNSGCDGNTGYLESEEGVSDEADASSLMKAKRKAAAQKVVQAD